MEQKYNIQSPAVKRLMRECEELSKATSDFHAQPCSDNLFEWHFTIRGAIDTVYEDGIYHGRISLPPEYPMKPPSILFLTPNGRFKIGEKICLSISGYHPETWLPSWSIRTALIAIIAFMPQDQTGGLGSLEFTAEERRHLAAKSHNFSCSTCNRRPAEILLPRDKNKAHKITKLKAKSLQIQCQFRDKIARRMGLADSCGVRASPPPQAQPASASSQPNSSQTAKRSDVRQSNQTEASSSSRSTSTWSDYMVPVLFLILAVVLYPRLSGMISTRTDR